MQWIRYKLEEGYHKYQEHSRHQWHLIGSSELATALVDGLARFDKLTSVQIGYRWEDVQLLESCKEGSPLARSWDSWHCRPKNPVWTDEGFHTRSDGTQNDDPFYFSVYEVFPLSGTWVRILGAPIAILRTAQRLPESGNTDADYRQGTITQLSISNVSASSSQLLYLWKAKMPNLKTLHIGNMLLTEGTWREVFEALERSKQLREFGIDSKAVLWCDGGRDPYIDELPEDIQREIEQFVVEGGINPFNVLDESQSGHGSGVLSSSADTKIASSGINSEDTKTDANDSTVETMEID